VNNHEDVFIGKLNHKGELVWSKTIGDIFRQVSYDILESIAGATGKAPLILSLSGNQLTGSITPANATTGGYWISMQSSTVNGWNLNFGGGHCCLTEKTKVYVIGVRYLRV
jgi:hypothetical protein